MAELARRLGKQPGAPGAHLVQAAEPDDVVEHFPTGAAGVARTRKESATMALSQSALNELLDALRAGGDLDVVRQALALQALIDAEATQQIGAGRYERSATNTTHRNGSRAGLLSTKAGDVELRIPKLREGSFFPALLEPAARSTGRCWRW